MKDENYFMVFIPVIVLTLIGFIHVLLPPHPFLSLNSFSRLGYCVQVRWGLALGWTLVVPAESQFSNYTNMVSLCSRTDLS